MPVCGTPSLSRAYLARRIPQTVSSCVQQQHGINCFARLREEQQLDHRPSIDERCQERPQDGNGSADLWKQVWDYYVARTQGWTDSGVPGAMTCEPETVSRGEGQACRTEVGKLMKYARRAGTPELLTQLALGGVGSCFFKGAEEVKQLKEEVVDAIKEHGLKLSRELQDMEDVPF